MTASAAAPEAVEDVEVGVGLGVTPDVVVAVFLTVVGAVEDMTVNGAAGVRTGAAAVAAAAADRAFAWHRSSVVRARRAAARRACRRCLAVRAILSALCAAARSRAQEVEVVRSANAGALDPLAADARPVVTIVSAEAVLAET